MITKTPLAILKMFTSMIIQRLRPMDVSGFVDTHYSHVYRTLKSLAAKKFLYEERGIYNLNYTENHQTLAYIEHLRSEDFLKKKRNRFIKLFVKDALNKIDDDSFIFILFGSSVNEAKPNDTDFLVIVDPEEKIEPMKRVLHNIADMSNLKKVDIGVISDESVYEMLGKRNQENVINELLHKHLIFYGAEKFYRMLAKGRACENAG